MRGFCSHLSLHVHAKDLIKNAPKSLLYCLQEDHLKRYQVGILHQLLQMQYIQGIDERKQVEKKKQDKYDIAKKEAVAKVKKE